MLYATTSGGGGCVEVTFLGTSKTNTAPLPWIDYRFKISYKAQNGTGHISAVHNGYPSYQVLKDGKQIYNFQQEHLWNLLDAFWVHQEVDF